jgi:hypothetical protein
MGGATRPMIAVATKIAASWPKGFPFALCLIFYSNQPVGFPLQ